MRLFFAPLLALSVFAAGCAVTASDSSGESAHEISSKPEAVKVVTTTAGSVLANADGMSLYTFDRDVTSESTCYGGCAGVWPALLVAADKTVIAPFGTTTRRDGALQLTLSGKPLYTFASDLVPGDVNGDGVGGVWHLARPVAEPPPVAPVQTVETTAGAVLANEDGMSLYTFDRDLTTDSTCYDACAARWPALVIAADTVVAKPFGTTTRRDGALQLTLSGKPLYTFANDLVPGDVNGDGVGGVWHLARPVATK